MTWQILLTAILIDRLLGEPPVKFHPVVWMGQVTHRWLGWFPPRHTPSDYVPSLGLILALTLIFVVPSALSPWWILDAILLSTTFSFGYFLRTVGALARTCAGSDLDAMRRGVGELVSRNTSTLTQEECIGAAIETTVENITDAVVAPLVCFLVGGVPLAVAYRILNTLDAMIGYKDKYFYYGKIPARLDDVANFLPARLVAVLIWGVAWVRGEFSVNAWKVFLRDRNKTESPNAGQTITAAAAVLRVRLSKREAYDLGDPQEELSPAKLATSVVYLRAVTYAFYALALGVAATL